MTELTRFSSVALLNHFYCAWSEKTATTWCEANPARGQCSVTALVAQDLLGGAILKTRVGDAWHFYNLVDGRRCDFTASQFPDPIRYDDVPSDRDEALSDTSPRQYEALCSAMSVLTTDQGRACSMDDSISADIALGEAFMDRYRDAFRNLSEG